MVIDERHTFHASDSGEHPQVLDIVRKRDGRSVLVLGIAEVMKSSVLAGGMALAADNRAGKDVAPS